MMFWTDHDPTGWGWFAMTAGMILFWGVLVVLAMLVVRALSRSADPVRPSSEQILAERFARGEIDEDEYRRRLATLRGSEHATPAR